MEQSQHTSVRKGLHKTDYNDVKILYFGNWLETETMAPAGKGCRRSNTPYTACLLPFRGTRVRWIGPIGPDHGFAEVYIDGVLEQTIDTYAPIALASQVLFEKIGLITGRIHTLRVVVRRERNQAASDCFQRIDGFECSRPVDYFKSLRRAAVAELRAIVSGTKAYLGPDTWKPVAYAATAPANGVILQPGLLRDCFDRNITYLNRCFEEPYYNDDGNNVWVQALPASAEGRLLGGAGHSLRWGERPDMRTIVDTIVRDVGSRQTADGYCLPYDAAFMGSQDYHFRDECRNYDRVNLTRGMLAAGMAGNTDAYGVMRQFYDWLNPSPYYPKLLTGNFQGSAHNCNNGHAGGVLMFFSPVGKAEDLVAVERYFVQDFFIDQARNAEPLSLGYYPLHIPHSYVLLTFEAWLDHYRATGAAKYLEASQGAWRIVSESYEHVGGTIAICEMRVGDYPPGSYYLAKHTGETCGSVFWADFNHRFLQLFPDEERYAAEIEKVIFNVILAAQDEIGSIRYHNHLHGAKQAPKCSNTCCEVMGVPFIARLPQFLYSVADDGVYVNLFAASSLTWPQAGQNVTLTTSTQFPYDSKVTLTLRSAVPVQMKLHIRVPSWAVGNVIISVNGADVVTGTPGSFASLDRTWSDNDRITFDLPMAFRPIKYTGLDQDRYHDRYAFEYGPVLMALVGSTDLDIAPDAVASCLLPLEGQSLSFGIAGYPNCKYIPYWQVQAETFTCFPTLR